MFHLESSKSIVEKLKSSSTRGGGGGGGGKGGGGKGGGDDGDESGAPLVDNDHYDHYSSMGSSEESRILL